MKAFLLFCLMILSLSNAVAGEQSNGVLYVEASEAAELVSQDSSLQVLDVRTPKEFASEHIKGAINIDYYADDFKQQVSQLDPEVTYLVHCRSGVRSSKALYILKSAGIKKLVHLDGGMKAWQKHGLPVQ